MLKKIQEESVVAQKCNSYYMFLLAKKNLQANFDVSIKVETKFLIDIKEYCKEYTHILEKAES